MRQKYHAFFLTKNTSFQKEFHIRLTATDTKSFPTESNRLLSDGYKLFDEKLHKTGLCIVL